MSLNVAGCRRSLAQILGQPMLWQPLLSLLCVAEPRPYTPDVWSDPAAVPRRASAFSASHGAVNSQVEAPLTVPFQRFHLVCWRFLLDHNYARRLTRPFCHANTAACVRSI